jgi:hypothetical protein
MHLKKVIPEKSLFCLKKGPKIDNYTLTFLGTIFHQGTYVCIFEIYVKDDFFTPDMT